MYINISILSKLSYLKEFFRIGDRSEKTLLVMLLIGVTEKTVFMLSLQIVDLVFLYFYSPFHFIFDLFFYF